MGKRILVLTPQFPYPPHQGTTMRNYNIIVQLARRHEVHLISFSEGENEAADGSPLAGCCKSVQGIPTPRRTMAQRLLATFLSPLPDMALRLPSEAFRERLKAALEEQPFDVLQVEGIEMAQYGLQAAAWRGERRWPLLVFEDHNAEYLLQRRAFEADVRRPRRWPAALYSLIQWRKLRRYEAQVCRVADRVVAVSEADKAALQRLVGTCGAAGGELPVTVVPNGIDLEFYQTLPQDLPALPAGRSLALVFTGKMDFRPNVDAVLWFGQEVLPLIRREQPEAHFYVVGQRPHARLAALGGNPALTITGAVPDVRPYISGAAVYVVPLRVGGGTRFKILEAMALGRPIVSTTMGCEGFPELADGENILIADRPEAFAGQVARLLRDPDARARLGEAARRIAPAYDWQAIVPRLEAAYGPAPAASHQP
jgi:sugar transferase (PEP-CTERM/EpsH1 system associated)